MVYSGGKELNIVLQKEITSYLHFYQYLCIILAYKENYPWFYENYIEIRSFFSSISKRFKGTVGLEYHRELEKIADGKAFGYPDLLNVGNIVEFIKENINLGYYVIIAVDEYYLPEKHCYKSIHNVHPSLIYGYDDLNKKLFAIGWTNAQILGKMLFDYSMFTEAYETGKKNYKDTYPWGDVCAITLFTLKPRESLYKLGINVFLKRFENYVNSINYSTQKGSLSPEEIEINKFGIDVYDVIIKGLNDQLGDIEPVDYRGIHFITEHSLGLYNRLNYLESIYRLENRTINFIKEYGNISQGLINGKNRYLKQILIENNYSHPYGSIKKTNILNKTTDLIISVKNDSIELLPNILNGIKEDTK